MTPPQGPHATGKAFLNPGAALQAGIRFTREGRFAEAIAYLQAARGRVAAGQEFAADFDLSLCYVGTGKPVKAIPILLALRRKGLSPVNVENLLAQAYIGAGQPNKAFEAFRWAVAINPHNEKLYLFVADACIESRSSPLGLRVVDLGLNVFPHSARLHYQRGIFLAQMQHSGLAIRQFHLAARYGSGRMIACMATAQAAFMNGNMPAAIDASRQGLRKSPDNYVLLTILGKAILRTGAVPGQPQFTEALQAMEKAVAERPDHADSQVTLGNLYLMAGQLDKAIAHLQKARALDPQNTSVYAHLADAYRQRGNLKKARQVLKTLARLNEQQAAAYRSGPPNQRQGYVSDRAGRVQPSSGVPHHE
jgi:tetratricopeptide (TPR) repeat protein